MSNPTIDFMDYDGVLIRCFRLNEIVLYHRFGRDRWHLFQAAAKADRFTKIEIEHAIARLKDEFLDSTSELLTISEARRKLYELNLEDISRDAT